MPDLFNQEREFEKQMRDMGNAYDKAMTPKTAKQAAAESRSALLSLIVALIVIGLAILAFVYLLGF